VPHNFYLRIACLIGSRVCPGGRAFGSVPGIDGLIPGNFSIYPPQVAGELLSCAVGAGIRSVSRFIGSHYSNSVTLITLAAVVVPSQT